MSGCSDQRLLAMISKEKLLKKMTAKTKSEVEVEVEDVGRQSVERWKDDIPFVCLRTVIQDARTAEFEIKNLKLKVRRKNFTYFSSKSLFYFFCASVLD